MPTHTCRYCNVVINNYKRFQYHLHTHINDSTINDFTQDELDSINKLYNHSKNIKRASRFKNMVNPKYDCKLCNYKCMMKLAFINHLMTTHEMKEISNNNVKSCIKKYNKLGYKYYISQSHKPKIPKLQPPQLLNISNSVPIPKLPKNIDLLPNLIPLALVIPLFRIN